MLTLFSSLFLYIAASHSAHVHNFSHVHTLLVVIYIYTYYFLEHVTFDCFLI